MKPIEPPEPTRINVAARDEEAARAALEAAGALMFDEQREQVRRCNSILLARVRRKIEDGDDSDDVYAQLGKCSAVAKAWSTEGRQAGGGNDPDDIDALKRAAKRAG